MDSMKLPPTQALLLIGVAVALLVMAFGFDVKKRDVLVIVAVLTLAANAVLVTSALRSSSAATQQASIAQRTLESQSQPMLLDLAVDLSVEDVPKYPGGELIIQRGGVHVSATNNDARCSLPLRNVGKGLARIGQVNVWLAAGDRQLQAAPHFVEVERPNLPAGEATRINFEFQGGDRGYAEWYETIKEERDFAVDVAYRDFAGAQEMTMRFTISRTRSPSSYHDWGVTRVDFAEPSKPSGVERDDSS